MNIYLSENVYGKELEICCENPMTGFFRNGMCDTCSEDRGIHTVCILITKDFLEYSKLVGNDLSTPHPEFEFSGLKPGDKWCLCAERWKEAYVNGKAPPVYLESTHKRTLEIIDFNLLQKFAVN
tara:strand:- start:277 stop:648 length:372 start_codon:yes stop_codon:yes gene_type:complete